MEFKLPKFVI